MGATTRPRRLATVLVIDDDRVARQLVRTGLELEGVTVLEAVSMADALDRLSPDLDGIVLDRRLPDGDGLALLPTLTARVPDVRVVVHSYLDDGLEPGSVGRVVKGNIVGLIEALANSTPPLGTALSVTDLVRSHGRSLIAAWRTMCRSDVLLTPPSDLPMATAVIAALTQALAHPQSLASPPDSLLEEIVGEFARNVGSLEAVIEDLTCLRQAFQQVVLCHVPAHELAETQTRLHIAVDRAIAVAAHWSVAELRHEATVDLLTGLGNRRAFRVDMARELNWASRHGRLITLVMIDADGLKDVNDREGHAAGDELLKGLATSLTAALRTEDSAYRLGGDEFILSLPETDAAQAPSLVRRIESNGAPPFSWGLSTFPIDAPDTDGLTAAADRRLLEWRRRHRAAEPRVRHPDGGGQARPPGEPTLRLVDDDAASTRRSSRAASGG